MTISDTIPAPKTSRGERTRQRLLVAAERQIGARGFAETSVVSITHEARVAQGTLYVYPQQGGRAARAGATHGPAAAGLR